MVEVTLCMQKVPFSIAFISVLKYQVADDRKGRQVQENTGAIRITVEVKNKI